jgi:hypothetical protein
VEGGGLEYHENCQSETCVYIFVCMAVPGPRFAADTGEVLNKCYPPDRSVGYFASLQIYIYVGNTPRPLPCIISYQ